MAIRPDTNSTMAGRITAADANYPFGSSKDETGAGANDGTPYFKARADDIFGFQQALLIEAGITPSGNADTALVSQYLDAAKKILKSGRKNGFLNPQFDLWQRGTNFAIAATSGTYTADRILITQVSLGSLTVSQEVNAPEEDSPFFFRMLQSSGQYQMEERIEDVRTYNGQNISFKVRAKADGVANCNVLAIQRFGSGGSPTVVTNLGTINIPSSGGFADFEVLDQAIPSTAGKTIGSNSSIAIAIELPAGAIQVDFDKWQVEPGSVTTDYERRPPSQILADCQRYYERYLSEPNPFAQEEDTTIMVTFKVTKATVPGVTKIFIAGTDDAAFSYGSLGGFRSQKPVGGIEDYNWTAEAEL